MHWSGVQTEAAELYEGLRGLRSIHDPPSEPLAEPVARLATEHVGRAELVPLSEFEEVKRERDQAWTRARSLERSLEIERHTARAVAREAVEAQEIWEAKAFELMTELAEAQSRLQHRQLVPQERLLQDIHDKMQLAVFQGQELKQSLLHRRPGSASTESSCRGSASIPLQPCSWFATQGTPCNHERENAELLERLLYVTEELHDVEAAKEASAIQAGWERTS